MTSKAPKPRAGAGHGRSYARKHGRSKAQRPGRPSLVELERRKAKVVKVATNLFVQHGYAATSLFDIAKRAHVATLTLYRHFGGKEAIFMEVLAAQGSGAVFQTPSVRDAESLHDGAMQIARYICEVSLGPKSQDLMRLSIAESGRFPDFITNLTQKTSAHFRQAVASMFEELTACGLAPQSDIAVSSSLFVDLIVGARPLLICADCTSSQLAEADLEERVALFILGRFGPTVAKRARRVPRRASANKESPRLHGDRAPGSRSRRTGSNCQDGLGAPNGSQDE